MPAPENPFLTPAPSDEPYRGSLTWDIMHHPEHVADKILNDPFKYQNRIEEVLTFALNQAANEEEEGESLLNKLRNPELLIGAVEHGVKLGGERAAKAAPYAGIAISGLAARGHEKRGYPELARFEMSKGVLSFFPIPFLGAAASHRTRSHREVHAQITNANIVWGVLQRVRGDINIEPTLRNHFIAMVARVTTGNSDVYLKLREESSRIENERDEYNQLVIDQEARYSSARSEADNAQQMKGWGSRREKRSAKAKLVLEDNNYQILISRREHFILATEHVLRMLELCDTAQRLYMEHNLINSNPLSEQYSN